jgi:ATP-dependent DNA helicase RecQ
VDPVQVLRSRFGFSAFRPGQEELVRAVLEGRDALGVLPTGGGKSLCYQVPALVLGGVTLVVTPLVSLMEDQVRRAEEAGIPAAALHAGLSRSHRDSLWRRARDGGSGSSSWRRSASRGASRLLPRPPGPTGHGGRGPLHQLLGA